MEDMHDKQRRVMKIAEFGVRTSEFERDTRKNFWKKGFKPKIFWMIAPFAVFILLTILVKYGVVHKNIIPYIMAVPMMFIPLFVLLPLWIFHKIGITRKVKKWLGDDLVDYIYGYARFWAFFILSLWITLICLGAVELGKGIF
ncbi:Uncharacterised protein [Campylobacter devanensis]|uniref:Membrane protein n=1 Tax=Campylobacter devanensis TaxID=3161138 RepID=A0A1X9STB3_9BACT|nr:hypothetical protein [Campylobacter lanienae]ARQ99425.1 putative membrane protein [Campylobacter lanienae]SUX02615.1 Uncharacterised protein [Campylobacter lanienae]